MKDEDEEINEHLRQVQHNYPHLSLAEMREIFDETYERLIMEIDQPRVDQ